MISTLRQSADWRNATVATRAPVLRHSYHPPLGGDEWRTAAQDGKGSGEIPPSADCANRAGDRTIDQRQAKGAKHDDVAQD